MTDPTPHPVDDLTDQTAHRAWTILTREQARDPLRRALAGLVHQIKTTLFVATCCGFGTWLVWVMSR